MAKQCGLAGKDDWEALLIDATVDTIHDVRASKYQLYKTHETLCEQLFNYSLVEIRFNMSFNRTTRMSTISDKIKEDYNNVLIII